MLNADGNVAEIRCVGPGAWHPSRVLLPVRGAGKIYWEYGVRGWHPLTPSWVPPSSPLDGFRV